MPTFAHDTAQIYYEVSGEGDAVLLLPGWGGNIGEFSELRGALSSAYKVIAADLPGAGRSGPMPRNFTPTYHQEDGDRFIAFVRHLGVGPVHLLGFSDGGEVALLVAAKAPDIARSVITWGAMGVLKEEHLPMVEVMESMIDNPLPGFESFRAYLIEQYGESNARAMSQSFGRAAHQLVKSGGDISLSKAGNITCPVLLVAGEHDIFVSPEHLSQLSALIPASETIVVEGAGHSVHTNRPEWFIETVVSWLKKQKERDE